MGMWAKPHDGADHLPLNRVNLHLPQGGRRPPRIAMLHDRQHRSAHEGAQETHGHLHSDLGGAVPEVRFPHGSRRPLPTRLGGAVVL
eukprot:8329487-Pyramimonas_sp.AAC.1